MTMTNHLSAIEQARDHLRTLANQYRQAAVDIDLVLSRATTAALIEHPRDCYRCTAETLYTQNKIDEVIDTRRHYHKKTLRHHAEASELAAKARAVIS